MLYPLDKAWDRFANEMTALRMAVMMTTIKRVVNAM
jgi:hypothetical protein